MVRQGECSLCPFCHPWHAGPVSLSDDILTSIRSRAAGYDRDNVFPHEDLVALRDHGYLTALVPSGLGGQGAGLTEMVAQQRRLAGASAPTALAVNMHLIVTAVARAVHRGGDDSLDWLLRDIAAGEICAFGISEAGNDRMLFDSATTATSVAGGVRFDGRKIFTSLSPVWTRLLVHGLDTTTPGGPWLVHAVLERGEGVQTAEDWDTLGMRATQSHSTLLDGAVAPEERIVRRVPQGFSDDPYVFGVFSHFLVLLSAVYLGMAERAVELAVAAAHSRSRIDDPGTRRWVAQAASAVDALVPQLDAVVVDLEAGVRGTDWPRRLSGLKARVVQGLEDAVSAALRVGGGSSMFSGSELGRLHRDALAGRFQPTTLDAAWETIAADLLGPLPPR